MAVSETENGVEDGGKNVMSEKGSGVMAGLGVGEEDEEGEGEAEE